MMPNHISMIMDGNRRFAWDRSMQTSRTSAGKQKLKEVMRWVLDLKIPYLTVYALSTENLISVILNSRPFSISMYLDWKKFQTH